MRIALGGCDLQLRYDSAPPRGLKESVFHNSSGTLPISGVRSEIEMLDAPISPELLQQWEQLAFQVDTKSTWAMKLSSDPEFPYWITPSPAAGFDKASLHARASRDFSKIQIHQGIWRNKFTDTWLFYPYEQCLMMHLLQFHGGAILHASGIEVDGKGYLFLGDSGAGKSTISTLFEEQLGENLVLSDDRIIVREIDGEWRMFGTPWHGTFARIQARSLPIGGMFFLEKTASHQFERFNARDSVRRLLPVGFGTWWLPDRFPEHLSFLERLATQRQFPLSRLGFAPQASVVAFLREQLLT